MNTVLERAIQDYVKQGFVLVNKTENSASLQRMRMSSGQKLGALGAGMMTFGVSGRNFVADLQDSVYILVDDKGKLTVTRGTARI